MNEVTLLNITKSFSVNTVVDNLSLKVAEGSFLSLLGPSGCGKTTVLRMVAGLEMPTSGEIRIGNDTVYHSGQNIYVPPEERKLGMVFQSYAIWPHMTVLENIMFPLRLQKRNKADRYEIALQTLKNVRLDHLKDRKPHQLSGGQQQRVALARALAASPRVILLDEPLSNLDANLRDEMCDEIIALRAKHPITMIYVTHDQREAFRLSDQIALMSQGKIEQMSSPEEIRTKPRTEFVKQFLKL